MDQYNDMSGMNSLERARMKANERRMLIAKIFAGAAGGIIF